MSARRARRAWHCAALEVRFTSQSFIALFVGSVARGYQMSDEARLQDLELAVLPAAIGPLKAAFGMTVFGYPCCNSCWLCVGLLTPAVPVRGPRPLHSSGSLCFLARND